MLKIATMDDYDLVLEMAKKFASHTEYKDLIEEDKIKEQVTRFLTTDDNQAVVFLYGDQGMIAGMVIPFMFGNTYMATEAAWWVEPEARKTGAGRELINVFEAWAKKVGCSLVTMISLDDELGKYYEKKGYRLYERAYLKELKD